MGPLVCRESQVDHGGRLRFSIIFGIIMATPAPDDVFRYDGRVRVAHHRCDHHHAHALAAASECCWHFGHVTRLCVVTKPDRSIACGLCLCDG